MNSKMIEVITGVWAPENDGGSSQSRFSLENWFSFMLLLTPYDQKQSETDDEEAGSSFPLKNALILSSWFQT